MNRRALSLWFALCIMLGAVSRAETVTLTLQQNLNSKMPTGTAFSATDPSGKVYHGHLVTHPARRFLVFLQYFSYPVVGLVLSVLPALEAHTRLLLGKYLEYRVTEKI